MPELPEVETIVRELRGALIGKKLQKFFVYDKKRLASPRLELPQKISSVRRCGKYIVCETDKNVCIMHLRMTGELLFQAPGTVNRGVSRHERASFHFSDGSQLRFHDVRRFGTIEWGKNGNTPPDLGPDPLSDGFNPRFLTDVTRKSARSVKSLLLDQKIIAGIGNIYADEALWHAKIHPARKSGTLTPAEAKKLVAAIKKVLKEGIKKGGFTLRDYRKIDGSSGHYQKSRKVYDREDENCLRCGAKIRRMKMGGRSSYYCSKCQKQ